MSKDKLLLFLAANKNTSFIAVCNYIKSNKKNSTTYLNKKKQTGVGSLYKPVLKITCLPEKHWGSNVSFTPYELLELKGQKNFFL